MLEIFKLSLLEVLERLGCDSAMGELAVESESCIKPGDVVTRIILGRAGTGRGFRYLSAGFSVLRSELVEPMLAFRSRAPLNATGTSNMLTS